jgi:hypothetical protein
LLRRRHNDSDDVTAVRNFLSEVYFISKR